MESISTQKATDSGNPFNFMPLCFCYVWSLSKGSFAE
jgi:hypothetical protein